MRLGVPTFHANLMSDSDVHIVRSTVTASGTTVGQAGLYLGTTGNCTAQGRGRLKVIELDANR